MKAVIYEQYGSPDVLRVADVKAPVPRDDQILIKIHAVSLNGSDREGLVGRPLYARVGGLWKPGNPILGSDIAGRVEAVGKDHTEFKVGDEVFGELPNYHGGLAEYAVTDGQTLAHKPVGLSFVEAAAIPQAGTIAYRGIISNGQAEAGQRVLINGAAGSGGSFAIQLAKMRGAIVTGVDHGHKFEFMRSLGADYVIDYTKENFTRTGQQYDLILDMIAHQSPSAYSRVLAPGGSYYCVGGYVRVLLGVLILGPWIKRRTNKYVRVLAVPQNRQDLLAITKLVESGQIKPVIDRIYSLDETVDAFQYLNHGHAGGKIVITID